VIFLDTNVVSELLRREPDPQDPILGGAADGIGGADQRHGVGAALQSRFDAAGLCGS